MAARGYVAQGRRSGGYLLGHRALELRSPVQRRTARLRRVARPHLERARQVCGETISLAVPVQSSVLWIDEVLGAPPVTPRVGRCAPAHAAAAGKALLATWSAAALDRLGAGGDLEAVTTRTLASPAALRDDLSLVRERGYAVEDEELEAGVVAVAAAIAVDGAAVGAIGVTGPAARLLGVGVDVLGEMASIFAGELARELARTAAPAVAA
jgi:DNA-binding IclR family transcriptional regulator